jgi:serine/threonine-protein kinase
LDCLSSALPVTSESSQRQCGDGGGGVLSEDFPALTGFRAGSLLAGYRLEAQVGAGGFAVVFRARDQRLGRLVALKILAPALTADAAFRRRFIAESRAAAAVDDPHIIPVHEAGEAGGVLFIAMRFVPGGDLRRVLDREGALAPGRAAEVLSPVASALDAAHAAGLVHRDVKPANILVDARPGRPDHVYLSDFGVSKGAVSSVSLTGAGMFLGTPDYSAPEQIEGRGVDGRADQYALACVAYQMLAGAVPFQRDQGLAVLLAHLSAPPPSLSSRQPGLPAVADEVLARGMAKVPEGRYGSCQEFADALRAAFGLAPYYPRDSASAPDHPQAEIPSPSSGLPGPAAAGTGKAAVLADLAAAGTATAVPPVTQTAPAPARSAASPLAAEPEAVVPAEPAATATPAGTATSGPPVTQTASSLAYSAAGSAAAEPDAGPATLPGAGDQRATLQPRDDHLGVTAGGPGPGPGEKTPRAPRAGRGIWRRPALIATAVSIGVIGLVIAIIIISGTPHGSAGPRSSGTPHGSASPRSSGASSSPPTTDTCVQGYVWREAVPRDHVCVTPETRAQAAQDNSLAASRRSPTGGAYGPDTCLQGYVWREAVPGDHVCVTPETRTQAAQDNSLAASRRAG